MSDLALALLLITGLFSLFLVVKHISKRGKFCAICLAVSATWLWLLALLWQDVFDNQVLISLLMGQTSLGVYYLLEKHAPEKLLVFRLPVLTSLIVITYAAVSRTVNVDALLVIAVIWAIFSLLYAYRVNPKLKTKVESLIECCSNW